MIKAPRSINNKEFKLSPEKEKNKKKRKMTGKSFPNRFLLELEG